MRVGGSGENQRGIDLLLRMETGTRWVIQCKRVEKFGKSDLIAAIKRAENDHGHHQAERYLLWVTGKVSAEATLLLSQQHPQWTLWSVERLTNEFIINTPRRECLTILQQCFDHAWAKAFFPIPEDLLIGVADFFSRWDGEGRIFHHRAELSGREGDLRKLVDFSSGGAGRKALILSARGGVGKSRLLKALAVRLEEAHAERSMRFVNPDAAPDADLPRYEDFSRMTIVHDDAHRTDAPRLLLPMMAHEEATGSRLILSTRPGAEDSLRERLMAAGYQAKDIETAELKPLTKPEMVKLAASLMGDVVDDAPRLLAELSGGCALITVVGAELIRRGELQCLDLQSSELFAREVFTRFEGQELDRVSSDLELALLKKVLRAIALLSPWQGREAQAANALAQFLGIPRGRLESACDSLRQCGLLVTTHEGLRVTPDLFSDHLIYESCFGEGGQLTEEIGHFLKAFGNENNVAILRNLAEAQWRAVRKHGVTADNVIGPLWRRFLREFEKTNFWERSRLLEKWQDFAIYLPRETIELAGWAMDFTTSPALDGYESLNSHNRVLGWLPHLLKPVAIWSEEHRPRALDLLWRLEKDFPMREATFRQPCESFAEIASFRHNFPQASNGVLDWIERKLNSEDGAAIADAPCPLLNMALQAYFARTIEINYWQDRRTFVCGRRAVSVSGTKAVRRHALALITDKIIPRGTVAAVNVLPVLGKAIQSSAVGIETLPAAQARRWEPERKLALDALAETARRHRNHWVHFVIRRQLHWHIVYGKDEKWRAACLKLTSSLLDTFEMRLARLTLSDAHDDSLDRYADDVQRGWFEQEEKQWKELLRETVREFVESQDDAISARRYLEEWLSDAERHGFDVRLSQFCSGVAQQDQKLALGVLDEVLTDPESRLADVAGVLLHPDGGVVSDEMESWVKRGFESNNEAVVRGFLNVFRYSPWLQTPANILRLLELGTKAEKGVLRFLIRIVSAPRAMDWATKLANILARRNLTDEQTRALVSEVLDRERHGDQTVPDDTIDVLMDRLAALPSLCKSAEDEQNLLWLAREHPIKLYQLFRRRIDYAEARPHDSTSHYLPMPYFGGVALQGLADLPDFESMARGLLDTIFSRPPDRRYPWCRLFIAAVSRTSSLLEQLLTERLVGLETKDDLLDLVSLLKFDHSVAVYRHPGLVVNILTKARTFGIDAFEEIKWALIHASRPTMRSYSNGKLDAAYLYAADEAGKAYEQYSDHPMLGPFYLNLVELEKADAEHHRRLAEASLDGDW